MRADVEVRFGQKAGARAVLLGAFGLLTMAAGAQINSSQATVNLNAVLAESLTISASPSALSFNLVSGGVATASSPVTLSTSWVLAASRGAVRLSAWFASPVAALSDGGSPANLIPSTLVYGQVATGTPTTYAPFTQSNFLGATSGALGLFSQSILTSTRASSRTDSLNLQIDLTTLPQLPAGTYTGVLILQAQSL